MERESKTYTFHVSGMHCKSCGLIIEEEIKDLSYVENVKVDLKHETLRVTGDFEGVPPESIAEDFSTLLAKYKYVVSIDKKKADKNWKDFKVAIPIAIGFAVLFVLLQKMGLVNLVDASKMNYGTVFIIGAIASLSSCLAIVGGLLLSMSATFAKEDTSLQDNKHVSLTRRVKKFEPQLMFHGGRLVSFFILGGIIGALGAVFQLNTSATFILGFIIGLVMLIMGLNLLDVFHFSKKLQPSMPKFLSKNAMKISKLNHTLTPLLVGIVTFFLPCGFTQSMQIYALSTGTFWTGAMTMFVFALGTLPALALVSFSSLSFQNNSSSYFSRGIFFKSAGLIVIMFALFNIINSLVVINVIPPIFNF